MLWKKFETFQFSLSHWTCLIQKNGVIPERPVDFVVQNWKLSFGYFHKFLANGKNLDYAWEILIDKYYKVIGWSNESNHYCPDADDEEWKEQFIALFAEYIWKEGILTSDNFKPKPFNEQ